MNLNPYDILSRYHPVAPIVVTQNAADNDDNKYWILTGLPRDELITKSCANMQLARKLNDLDYQQFILNLLEKEGYSTSYKNLSAILAPEQFLEIFNNHKKIKINIKTNDISTTTTDKKQKQKLQQKLQQQTVIITNTTAKHLIAKLGCNEILLVDSIPLSDLYRKVLWYIHSHSLQDIINRAYFKVDKLLSAILKLPEASQMDYYSLRTALFNILNTNQNYQDATAIAAAATATTAVTATAATTATIIPRPIHVPHTGRFF